MSAVVTTRGVMKSSKESAVHDVEAQIAMLFSNGRRIVRQAAHTVHPDLQPMGLYMLRRLLREGPARPSAIAEFLEVDRSAISRLITSVEALGLIERRSDPADKRAYELALTQEGEARLALLTWPLRGVLDGWEEEDLKEFARLLSRLNEQAAR
jgi:DNA-binding MarR family transcriptional regulator